MRNKIVYIISTLKKSGPVIVLYNIVKNLDPNCFEPIIITLSKEPIDSMKNDFEENNVKIVELGLSRLLGFIIGGFKLRKIVKNINPNIIHLHSLRGNILSILFLKKYKKIITIHADYEVDHIMLYGKFVGCIMNVLTYYSILKIKNIVCVSEYLAILLRKKYKSIKFYFINNGIDIDKFKPIEKKDVARIRLKIPTNKKIFIWTGVFVERKNPLLLIDAINKLKREDFFFIFCGSGKLEKDCKNKLKNKKNSIFLGHINNVEEYLQISDYYIATSLSEGLPNSVLEAMACGLPVVLSNIPQHMFILKGSKEIGLLYSNNNVDSLLEQITKILEVKYDTVSKNSREYIKNNFSAFNMAKEYEKLYLKL